MKNQKFSVGALRALIAESATFSYFFGMDRELFEKMVLGMKEEAQKKIFEALLQEKEKMAEIQKKYAMEEAELVSQYMTNIKMSKKKLEKDAKKMIEKAEAKKDTAHAEKLLNEIE